MMPLMWPALEAQSVILWVFVGVAFLAIGAEICIEWIENKMK